MHCCEYCFSDEYLISKIKSFDEKGDCEYCHSENVYIISIFELTDDFEKLINYYETTEPYQHFHPEVHDDPCETGADLLIRLINEDWTIFSDKIEGTNIDEQLLDDILNSCGSYDNHVDISGLFSRIETELTFMHPMEGWEDIWTTFKNELKHSNRFFPEMKEIIFGREFEYFVKHNTDIIDKNTLYYRARIGKHDKEYMKSPPSDKVNSGRANPHGISYLYCSDNEDTSVSEIRPWKGATITIASLKLNRQLKVIKFMHTRLSPFTIESPTQAMQLGTLLSHFSKEMSTPVDPNAGDSEYLPTQYITELVKAKGYDGIMFKSAMGKGINFVLFNDSDVDVQDVKNFEINQVLYEKFPKKI